MESLHINDGKDTVNTSPYNQKCFIITCILFGLLSSSKANPTGTNSRNYSYKSYFSNNNFTKEYDEQIKINLTLSRTTVLPINSFDDKKLTTQSQNYSKKIVKDTIENSIPRNQMVDNESRQNIQVLLEEKNNDFLLKRNDLAHLKKKQKIQDSFNTDYDNGIHIKKNKSHLKGHLNRNFTTKSLNENSYRTIMELNSGIKMPYDSVVIYDKLPLSEMKPSINTEFQTITDFNRFVNYETDNSNMGETNIKSHKNHIHSGLTNSKNLMNENYYNNESAHLIHSSTVIYNRKINESTTEMFGMVGYDDESPTKKGFRDNELHDDDYVICRQPVPTHKCSKRREGCLLSRLITIILIFILTVLALTAVFIRTWRCFMNRVPRDRCIECRFREREE